MNVELLLALLTPAAFSSGFSSIAILKRDMSISLISAGYEKTFENLKWSFKYSHAHQCLGVSMKSRKGFFLESIGYSACLSSPAIIYRSKLSRLWNHLHQPWSHLYFWYLYPRLKRPSFCCLLQQQTSVKPICVKHRSTQNTLTLKSNLWLKFGLRFLSKTLVLSLFLWK